MSSAIPTEAMQYLKHLPTIANWIKTNKQISGIEMVLFKRLYSEPYWLLKGTTYEEIRTNIGPYQDDPQHGQHVQLALSEQGENWLRYALDLIKQS